MNDIMSYDEETQNEAKKFLEMLENNSSKNKPTTFPRLTLMNAMHCGYVVLSQSGAEQVVLFAGCLRECLEFIGKNIERV